MSITDKESLREYYGEPSERSQKKGITRLDVHCRNFIAMSPFLVLSTAGANGSADTSPKGDAPGFVQVLDDTTLVIPDRIGNNRVDSFQNVMENPHVGLLFLVPGISETLRINGRARLSTDGELLESLAVNGKPPRAALVVEVDEAFLHCAKALYRSKLWDAEAWADVSSYPGPGKVFADHIGDQESPADLQKVYDDHNKTLY